MINDTFIMTHYEREWWWILLLSDMFSTKHDMSAGGTTSFRTTMPSKGAPEWGLPITILIIVLAAWFDNDDYD